jgi:hypothetical protein
MVEENDNDDGSGSDLFGESLETVEAELFPPQEPVTPGGGDSGGDPDPLASGDAPWVGAEEKWLRGIGEPSGSSRNRDDDTARQRRIRPVDEEVLLIAEQVPQLPSLVPQPPSDRSVRFEIGIVVTLLLVVGAAIGIVYWMDRSFTEREQEILALRQSDRQEVARLEREIRELMARGGAENEARAKELRAELQARQEAAAQIADQPVADQGVAEGGEQSDEERGRRRTRDSEGDGETGAPLPQGEPAPLPDYPEDDPPPVATAAAGAPGSPGSEVDEILDGAFRKPVEAPVPAPATAAAPTQGADRFPVGAAKLPESPSREQVKSTMDAVAPLVARCSAGGGRIVVSVTVAGATGRVVSAEATGEAAGTQLGQCAERAVKLAKFPPFEKERLQIKYPFDL